jgi:hypothetical protein
LGLDLCILRFAPETKLTADFVNASGFLSVTRTDEELSVVCQSGNTPSASPQKTDDGWKAFKVKGPLDFSLTGILAAIAKPLAENGVSIFAVSTFDTDYVLVKEENFSRARDILGQNFTLE